MFYGEFYQQTDEKGRVRIPAKLKPAFGEHITITKGTDGCLFLFGEREWSTQFAEKLTAIPASDESVRRSVRVFFSSASELENDNQGRSLLPRNLREYANIKKDIVFIGVGNRAELWAKETYDAYMSGKLVKATAESTDFDKLFAELKKYGV